ncbi:hypothetical protein C7271_16370 [filamentous cyanobacterium CCP5]|nr:hypothetical protein C7271_16370 [filamentous cyanobacterium CCP5]
MDLNSEISRLRELMPASGRMKTRLDFNDNQPQVIAAPTPRPWQKSYPIIINLSRWLQLSEPQRDMLYLRTVCWLTSTNVLQPNAYAITAAAGLIAIGVELIQTNAVGVLAAGGLSTLAIVQAWRRARGPQQAIAADEQAIRVALRRGYSEVDALQALLGALEAVPALEGSTPSVTDLIRCQNLRAKLGLSGIRVSEEFLQT